MDSKLGNLNLYDQIVASVVANNLAEAARTNNKIYLKWFDPEQASHNVYFEGASIAATVLKSQIYLDMPLPRYIIFKLKNWKRRKQLKWIHTNKVPEAATQIQLIINHICRIAVSSWGKVTPPASGVPVPGKTPGSRQSRSMVR